jgi:hypothetical protein
MMNFGDGESQIVELSPGFHTTARSSCERTKRS